MTLISLKNEYSNNKKHKVLNIFGLKLKFKQSSKYERALKKKYDPNISLKDKKIIIEHQFKEQVGYKPNIDNPQTFNEKMQWLKLYYTNPQMTKCADKYLVRDYIKEKISEEYLIPLIGVYSNPDEIDFNTLPNQFVLKVNWGSGQNIIVKDKSTLNIEETKQKLNKWLEPHSNHYYYSFEPSYKNIEPKIICEPYIGELSDNLTCYKIFNFNSKPHLIQAVFDDKTSYETINYYDLNWNKLDLKQNFPNNKNYMLQPKNLSKMLVLAEKLAEPFKYFVRTDFYEIGDKVLFSEFTFFSDNGMAAFEPSYWDNKLGKLINILK